jgi:hypothetical protein
MVVKCQTEWSHFLINLRLTISIIDNRLLEENHHGPEHKPRCYRERSRISSSVYLRTGAEPYGPFQSHPSRRPLQPPSCYHRRDSPRTEYLWLFKLSLGLYISSHPTVPGQQSSPVVFYWLKKLVTYRSTPNTQLVLRLKWVAHTDGTSLLVPRGAYMQHEAVSHLCIFCWN